MVYLSTTRLLAKAKRGCIGLYLCSYDCKQNTNVKIRQSVYSLDYKLINK